MAAISDELVRELLDGRYIASLATTNPDGSTHVVAVWYHFDGSHINIATSSRSRKARNLLARPKASIMIDARDPLASRGVNIAGSVRILSKEDSLNCNLQVHRKYLSAPALADPRVGNVFAAWDDITLQITPTSVRSWDMRDVDRQVLGGAFQQNPEYLLPLAQ
jgi:PPOX class probable F420-dependent enzyme